MKKSTRYEIRGVDGTLRAIHERIEELSAGETEVRKKFWWRHPDGRLSGRDVHNVESMAEEDRVKPTQLPLYGSQDLAKYPTADVVIVEGEKCRDVAQQAIPRESYVFLGTVTGGGGGGEKTHSDAVLAQAVKGRTRVVLLPDNDRPGHQHMEVTGKATAEHDVSVRLLELPDLPPKGDVVDFLATHSAEELTALLEGAPPFEAKEEEKGRDVKGDSQAARIAALGAADVEPSEEVAALWQTPDGESWASILRNGHQEHWPVRSRPFRLWIRQLYFAKHSHTLGTKGLSEGLEDLEAQALFHGPVHPVHTRVADLDGAVYIDLGDQAWRAVRVSAKGWAIVQESPVRFRRKKGLLPFAEPARGGTLTNLDDLLPGLSEDGRRLFVVCLVSALRPRGPYVVTTMRGEQGSGKTTSCRMFVRLTDPNTAALRRPPKDDHDLAIAARNGWVIGYDNLSHLSSWLSDALCGLATGGAFAARQLYSDDEEALFDYMRPVLLNGIVTVVTSHDLRDREVVIDHAPMQQGRRREEELWATFDALEPGLFGAVLDALSGALREVPAVDMEELPRMADFAVFGVALERALGWPAGSFMQSYNDNRGSGAAAALDDSLIAKHIRAIARDGEFSDTASTLLAKLNDKVDEDVRRDKAWPKAANTLSAQLRRLAPDLRSQGWADVQFPDDSRPRRIVITRAEKQ